MDTIVKTNGGRIVLVGDVIKTLRACAESTGCAECTCESIEDCMEHMYDLIELVADVLEVLTADETT